MDIKQQLLDKYKYKIELHAHSSPVSKCSEISPKELVEFYIENGYDAFVLTNHFTPFLFENRSMKEGIDFYLEDYFKAKNYAKDRIKVFLGAEIRFKENRNEFLIYGVNRDILQKVYDYFDKGVDAFRKEVKLDNSLFIQAHPFRENCTPINPNLLEGVEVYNMHPGHNSKPALAVDFANEFGFKIKTVGSDFHHPIKGHIGIAYTRTSTLPRDSFDLVKILKDNEYVIQIGNDILI